MTPNTESPFCLFFRKKKARIFDKRLGFPRRISIDHVDVDETSSLLRDSAGGVNLGRNVKGTLSLK